MTVTPPPMPVTLTGTGDAGRVATDNTVSRGPVFRNEALTVALPAGVLKQKPSRPAPINVLAPVAPSVRIVKTSGLELKSAWPSVKWTTRTTTGRIGSGKPAADKLELVQEARADTPSRELVRPSTTT